MTFQQFNTNWFFVQHKQFIFIFEKIINITVYLNFKTFNFCVCVVKISMQFRYVNALKICIVLINLRIFFEFFSYELSSTKNAVTTIHEVYCFTRSLIRIIRFDFVDSLNKMKILFSILFFVKFIAWFWRNLIVAFKMHTKTIVWNIVDEKKFCNFFTQTAFISKSNAINFIIHLIYLSFKIWIFINFLKLL